jgi:hypothetical protein
MALKLLQPGVQPLGQFDGLDSEVLTLKGGEVVTLKSVAIGAATDKGASDTSDGYVNSDKRVVVTKTLASGKRPLMLADEGVSGYGTLFGTVVGGTVGQVSTGGTVLGPHTATGSGKVTCWDKPGLYAVSLDACDTTASTGLAATNATLDTGAALYATSAGLLTPNSGSAFESVVVGRFVSFETNGSLVTSQNHLVTALNSPTGSSAPTKTYAFATFFFNPEV